MASKVQNDGVKNPSAEIGAARVGQILTQNNLPSGKIRKIGEGAFGEVFLVEAATPYAVKLCKKKEMVVSEARTLTRLAALPTACVPKVICVVEGTADCDALVMSYLSGVLMSEIRLKKSYRLRAAREIAAAVQGLILEDGKFGYDEDCDTWYCFYHQKAAVLLQKAQSLAAAGALSAKTLDVMERAFASLGRIFEGGSVRRALIHGDLNPQNIMLRADGSLVGFIDPIGSFVGDSEYEFFQLETNGGNRYPVLKEYQKTLPLSNDYPLKRDVYRLFAEVGYYCDTNLSEDKTIRRYARSLAFHLKKFRI